MCIRILEHVLRGSHMLVGLKLMCFVLRLAIDTLGEKNLYSIKVVFNDSGKE